jgi:hypothetical protein
MGTDCYKISCEGYVFAYAFIHVLLNLIFLFLSAFRAEVSSGPVAGFNRGAWQIINAWGCVGASANGTFPR